MYQLAALVILLAIPSAAFGDALSDALAKVAADPVLKKKQQCRFAPTSLIGLSREQLREKCGLWSYNSLTVTASGRSELMTYRLAPRLVGFYVFLTDGIVTAVNSQ